MAKSKRVEFKTMDGITLRGDFYQAMGDKRPIAWCGENGFEPIAIGAAA
jgi:hypothetical protein